MLLQTRFFLFLHLCILLCALEDGVSQSWVRLHRRGDQGREQRQVPDGRSVRDGHLFTLGDLITQGLQSMNARVASIAQAPLDVYLDVWELFGKEHG